MTIVRRTSEPAAVRRTTWTLASLLFLASISSVSCQKGKIDEPMATQQVPWLPLRLQLQHDKPLVLEGRVLTATGRPLEKADVAVMATLRSPGGLRPLPSEVLGQVTTDGTGAFSATMPSLPPYQVQALYAIARRADYGMCIKELDVAALRQALTLRLEQEQLVRGRVTGPDDQPAPGVNVHLRRFWMIPPGGGSALVSPRCGPESRPLAWPEPPITDGEGRFVLRGIPGSEAESLGFDFVIDDPRFAPFDKNLYFAGLNQFPPRLRLRDPNAEELAIQLEAPTFVEGKVICRDTKQPIAHAWLSIHGRDLEFPPADTQCAGVWVQADVQGRFRARLRPSKYAAIYVYPPPGLPYPAWGQTAKVSEGAARLEVTVEVPRGILLRGRVVEEESGVGVPGAGVEYQLRRQKTPHYDEDFAHIIYWAAEYRRILTRDDGTFEVAAVPGLGSLMVKAPTPDFISRYVTYGDLQSDNPGGRWYVMEGRKKIDPKPGTNVVELTIPLRRGITVRCHVVGPQGQLVDKAVALNPTDPYIGFFADSAYDRSVANGSLELQGCDPARTRRIYLLDAEHQWGATVDVNAARAQDEPLTIRLLPCGSATVRFVDQDDHPWANWHRQPLVSVRLVFLKGPVDPIYGTPRDSIEWSMSGLDRDRYASLQADAQGRVTFPTLIPGAPYTLRLFDRVDRLNRRPKNPEEVKEYLDEYVKETEFEFSVQPGQTLDLGEITLIRPKDAK